MYKNLLKSLWLSIRQRCKHPNKVVCTEWNNFENFYSWALEQGYKPGLELDADKINLSLGFKDFKIYSPSTCLFLTKRENISLGSSIENNTTRKLSLTKDDILKAIESLEEPTAKTIAECIGRSINTTRGYLRQYNIPYTKFKCVKRFS